MEDFEEADIILLHPDNIPRSGPMYVLNEADIVSAASAGSAEQIMFAIATANRRPKAPRRFLFTIEWVPYCVQKGTCVKDAETNQRYGIK